MMEEKKPDMGEVIKNILEAEARAEEITANAKAKCKEITADAEAEAAAIKAQSEEQVKDKLRQEAGEAALRANRLSELARKQCSEEQERLAKLAHVNSSQAVKIILERLTNRYAG